VSRKKGGRGLFAARLSRGIPADKEEKKGYEKESFAREGRGSAWFIGLARQESNFLLPGGGGIPHGRRGGPNFGGHRHLCVDPREILLTRSIKEVLKNREREWVEGRGNQLIVTKGGKNR